MIILREFLKEKRWYNEEIKIGKFCDILYITGSKSDLLVYTGQKRRPDRTGHYNGLAGVVGTPLSSMSVSCELPMTNSATDG